MKFDMKWFAGSFLALIAMGAILGLVQAQERGDRALAKAELTSPKPDSTLAGDTETFAWSEGQGVLRYGLVVGTTIGSRDLYRMLPGSQLSVKVTNIPTDGSPVYVRLFSEFESGWEFNDYRLGQAYPGPHHGLSCEGINP